jgi:hypothetical protein
MLRALLKLPLRQSMSLDVKESLINVLYDQSIAAAKKSDGDVDRIEWDRIFELGHVQEEREEVLTAKLCSEARRFRVPVPNPQYSTVNGRVAITGDWEMGEQTREVFLSPQGYQKLRMAIREERKARREARSHMINWIIAWTGLLGAAAAIIGAYAAILALRHAS